MKTIKIEDVLYHDKGVQMVKDAEAIYRILLKLTNTISNRDDERPKFGQEQRMVLSDLDYSVIGNYLYRDAKLKKEFTEDCLDPLFEYLVKKIKSIKGKLKDAEKKLYTSAYNYRDIRNNIVMLCNDLFAVENTIEERKFNSFSDMIKYIDKAFNILNDRLDIIPARFEAGQKYIFFLSRLRTLCSDIINSMEIEVY